MDHVVTSFTGAPSVCVIAHGVLSHLYADCRCASQMRARSSSPWCPLQMEGYGCHLNATGGMYAATESDTATANVKTLVQTTVSSLSVYKSVLSDDTMRIMEEALSQPNISNSVNAESAKGPAAPQASGTAQPAQDAAILSLRQLQCDMENLFTPAFINDARAVGQSKMHPGLFLRRYGTHFAEHWYGGEECKTTVATFAKSTTSFMLKSAIAARAAVDAGVSHAGAEASVSAVRCCAAAMAGRLVLLHVVLCPYSIVAS